MNPFKVLVLIASLLFLPTSYVQAKKPASQNSNSLRLWERGDQSVIDLGVSSNSKGQCKVFEIKMDTHLHLNIDCDGITRSEKIQLSSGDQYTVSQAREQWTLIKYNYLHKKPQTSRMTQSRIKIPYVEEVIHIKRLGASELAFYLEGFKVDEFGRIVQNKYIQAHGLKARELKVSAH